MASAAHAVRIPEKLTVQSVTECLEQHTQKWQQQLALQKKELFFWFHAETRGRDEALERNKHRIAELEAETARLSAQNTTLAADLEKAEGKLAAAESRAVAFETQCSTQQRDFEAARDQLELRRRQSDEQSQALWERRTEEKEGVIADLRAKLGELNEEDFRKKQELYQVKEQLTATERDAKQSADAAQRHAADLQRTGARVKRQLLNSRQTANRCVQELFQLTETARTTMLAEENAVHALFAQSDTWRHALARQAAAGVAEVDLGESVPSDGGGSGKGHAPNASLPQPVVRKSSIASGGGLLSPHGGVFSDTFVPLLDGDDGGEAAVRTEASSSSIAAVAAVPEGGATLQSAATVVVTNRAAAARRAAEHVRQLKNEALEAVEAMQQLKDEIRDANAERDADARVASDARLAVEQQAKAHEEHVRLLQQEWEQARAQLERQRSHEVRMATEQCERVRKTLADVEDKMRTLAESESKLQAEAYAFRSMHHNYLAQIEHYKKAAHQAQTQLKAREDDAWQHKMSHEKLVTELKNARLQQQQLKGANEAAENKVNEANDRRARDETAAQQRIAALERSLLASVNEVHSKTRDFKALQRKIEELTSKVEESQHASELAAAHPNAAQHSRLAASLLAPPPFGAFGYPNTQQSPQPQHQYQQQQHPYPPYQGQLAAYFLPPLSPAPPPIPLSAFPSLFDSVTNPIDAVRGGGGGNGGPSPPRRGALASVAEERDGAQSARDTSYTRLKEKYDEYHHAPPPQPQRRDAGGAAAGRPPLAPRAFMAVQPPNQGPTPAEPTPQQTQPLSQAPGSARASSSSKIPAPSARLSSVTGAPPRSNR